MDMRAKVSDADTAYAHNESKVSKKNAQSKLGIFLIDPNLPQLWHHVRRRLPGSESVHILGSAQKHGVSSLMG